MLPYMGYQQLYEQFHLDEPWDSEHNKKLIEQMPMEYATPGNDASEGLTNYLGVAGKNRMFQSPNERDFGKINPTGIGFRNVVDGTSNTIMLVEVNNDHRVVWSAPEDFEAPGMEPVARMAGLWKMGFHSGMADGSVQMLPLDIDEKVLSNLFQINDGEYVEIPRIR